MGVIASQVGFQNFVSENGLREIRTNKCTFTWSN